MENRLENSSVPLVPSHAIFWLFPPPIKKEMDLRVCGHRLAGRAAAVPGAAQQQLVPYQSSLSSLLTLTKLSKKFEKINYSLSLLIKLISSARAWKEMIWRSS